MTAAPRKIDWSTVATSLLSVIVLLATWTFGAGKLTGTNAADIAGLQERQTRLEERQTRLETLMSDRLERIIYGQAELKTSLETLRAEQRILHKQMGRWR